MYPTALGEDEGRKEVHQSPPYYAHSLKKFAHQILAYSDRPHLQVAAVSPPLIELDPIA